MRSIKRTIISALFVLVAASSWADSPKTASAILEDATKASKTSKKPIWLIFDASW